MTNGSRAAAVSRRTLLLTGGAVVAAGAGAYAFSRGVDNSGIKPISYSFEDSNECVLTATMTEGPFYVHEALVRRDIRDGRPGAEVTLRLKIVDGATCAAIPGATVDVWHCDAEGNYSAAPQLGREQRSADGHLQPTDAQRFLRGRQVAGDDGVVEFVTIYPGWYRGRTPHIHMKVFAGEREVATSQMFFAKGLSDEVYATAPYAARGPAETTNDDDGVLYAAGGGNGAWPKMTRDGSRLTASLTVGIARAAA